VGSIRRMCGVRCEWGALYGVDVGKWVWEIAGEGEGVVRMA